ncbi:hypothetical protein GCM10022234_34080 [Aeromicrobium panaciterrae]|uniref:DUF3710 domain-containing protein n=1 Tax=Aeromicrobium panaciterrae TaxID=363861 RepID=UPI0031D16C4D
MARFRKKDAQPQIDDQPIEETGGREHGPWDSTEKSVVDDPTYVDLGSLIVRGHDDYALQLPADNDDGEIGSVLMVAENGALELRAFAATRSGGLWDEVRSDIVAEVERLGGEAIEDEGPHGPELKVTVPATTPDGETGVQPSRIMGIEGPRWLLRATLLGEAALVPEDHILMDALNDVIVVRGEGPKMLREPLLLRVPPNAVPAPPEG